MAFYRIFPLPPVIGKLLYFTVSELENHSENVAVIESNSSDNDSDTDTNSDNSDTTDT